MYNDNEKYGSSNALNYDESIQFHSKDENKPQFWGVYFKVPVSISGYEIKTYTVSTSYSSLYNWTFSLSMDNTTWNVVHGPLQSTSTTKSHNFSQSYNALYARINGDSLYSSDKTKIRIHFVKFFGSIMKIYNNISCRTNKRMNISMYMIVLLFFHE